MNYWSWKGKYVGARSGNNLYSKNGNPIGYFRDNELYSFEGRYIGEIKNTNRLIVSKSKKCKRASAYAKPCNRAGSSYCNYAGYAMLAGYEDFEY